MNCRFGHTCPELYHPRPIVHDQVDRHHYGYGGYEVHADANTYTGTPTMGKALVSMHGWQQMHEQHQLPVTVFGRTYEMPVRIYCDLPCPMLLG